MKFFFCEKCGKRVTDADVESGQARDKQAKGIFCRDCSTGVMTMTFEAMSEKQAHDHLKKELPSSAMLPPAAPAKPPSRESQTRMAPSFRKPATKASPQQNHSVMLFAAGGAGALALLLIAWFAFSSKPQESEKGSISELKASPPAQKPPAQPEAQPPSVPAPVPAPDTSPAGTEKTREAAAVPAKTVPGEEKDAKSGEKSAPSKDPSPVEFKDGLMVHMKFDGNLVDSGPLSLQVTCKNQACDFRDGIFGKAIATSTADNANLVMLPRNKALYASEVFGVAFWVRLEQVSPKTTWVVWNHCRWGIGFKAKSTVLMLNGLAKNHEFKCPTVSDKAWHHVAVSWDGKNASCYFEGQLVESCELTSVNLKNNMTWTISILGNPWHESMVGALDGFRLYNRPITAAEAAQLAKR